MNIREKFINTIRDNCIEPGKSKQSLNYFRNELFAGTLIYLIPLPLNRFVTSLYRGLNNNNNTLIILDSLNWIKSSKGCGSIFFFTLPDLKNNN